MPRSARRLSLAAASLLIGVGAAVTPTTATIPAASASDSIYAPLNRPGPKLSVPAATLNAALKCYGDPTKGPRPVLLNPATSVTPVENYSWNWQKVLRSQGRYVCTVTMPYHTFGDIQVAGEYLVNAIRVMHRRTGRKIAILGHSQGGMSPRWALRFWPGVRPMVAELIGMAPSSHGTTVLAQCIEGVTKCVPAVWQQRDEARFIKAVNSRAETFAGIDYTMIYTQLDEVVTPPASSGLHTGGGRIANIRVQDVCPADPYEHVLTGTVSPATYAAVMDALTHDGPARLSRIDRSWCGRLYMPGVNPVDLAAYLPVLLALPRLVSTALPSVSLGGAPLLAREPRLRCYTLAAGC